MEKRYKIKFVGVGPSYINLNGQQTINNGDILEVDDSAYESLRVHSDFEEVKQQKQSKESE